MATLKTCFKCNEAKPRTEFYKHPAMNDGLLGKCKVCTRKDVKAHREANLDRVRLYDSARAILPHRVALRARVTREWRAAYPERRAAHSAVAAAVRQGSIIPQPCWVCGEQAEAHHPDYSRPLDVVWLCSAHHKQAHALLAA